MRKGIRLVERVFYQVVLNKTEKRVVTIIIIEYSPGNFRFLARANRPYPKHSDRALALCGESALSHGLDAGLLELVGELRTGADFLFARGRFRAGDVEWDEFWIGG